MASTLVRREFLRLAAGTAASAAAPLWLRGQQAEPHTYTYKKAGELEIKADVYPAAVEGPRPIVVWIHGGALIMGNRRGISDRIRSMALGAGYVLVSIDYRLAPESKLPAVIEDVQDAFRWIRKAAEQFHGDAGKIAVMGGSAGGYLTLVAGYRVQPRPSALVSFWGYGDLIGDWYSTPSPHARHQEIRMSSEEAQRQVSGPPLSDAADRKGDGGAFYQHCRQHGIWPREVSGGWDPRREPEKFYPFMPLRNVTKEFPPTLLIHGTADTDVPYLQSVLMAEQFEKHAVEHELISIAGGEHGLGGGDPQRIDAAYASAAAFLQRHLGR
jgi:acetyl esterase/lipase